MTQPARADFTSDFCRLFDPNQAGQNIVDCLTCGICTSRCSWYDGPGGPNPRMMVRMAQLGLEELLAQSPMIWDCMLCNHCTVACPMGIVMEEVVRRARNHPAAAENIPEDIRSGVQTRLECGDVNGFTAEDFVETIDWINEEIADETDDPRATIAKDRKGADYLYLPNPRELGTNVLHLQAMARLFAAMGLDWTMSSRHTDVTNWGYFIGDEQVERTMALQVVEAAEDLGVRHLVLSECGHGFLVLRKRIEALIGRKPRFAVLSIVELVDRMAEKGAVRFSPDSFTEPVAYHDPCNLGRKSGVFDAPRRLLARFCPQVVELVPNRHNAICCGGGGALLQDSSSKPRRMVAGKAKADQIRASGAVRLATSCLSCHRQLTELCQHYGLKVRVDTVAAMAAEALAD